jgi:hypothetical protein
LRDQEKNLGRTESFFEAKKRESLEVAFDPSEGDLENLSETSL